MRERPSKQWRMLPESSFVFDPRTSLPVPRGILRTYAMCCVRNWPQKEEEEEEAEDKDNVIMKVTVRSATHPPAPPISSQEIDALTLSFTDAVRTNMFLLHLPMDGDSTFYYDVHWYLPFPCLCEMNLYAQLGNNALCSNNK